MKKVYRLLISAIFSWGHRNPVGFVWSLNLCLPKESMLIINTFINSIPIHISIKLGYFSHFDNILKTIHAEILWLHFYVPCNNMKTWKWTTKITFFRFSEIMNINNWLPYHSLFQAWSTSLSAPMSLPCLSNIHRKYLTGTGKAKASIIPSNAASI